MTDKLKITLEDLGALEKPVTPDDIAEVNFLVDTTLRHTGANPVAALALLVSSISALAARCDEHVGVLAAAWFELEDELRGHGPALAEASARMNPRVVAALTDGEFLSPSEPKPGWKEEVFADIDAAAARATPPSLDSFDHVGDTQDLPKEDL